MPSSLLSRLLALLLLLSILRPSHAQDAQAQNLKAIADEKLAAIEREVQRLRDVNEAEDANTLSATLKHLRLRLDGKDVPAPNDPPEVHVVAIHEARKSQDRMFGEATVEVSVTDRPIILVVCAYNPIRWTIRAAEGAKIQRLIFGGYHTQELAASPSGVPVEKHIHEVDRSRNYFHAYKEDGEGYARAEQVIRQLTGSHITTFTGSYGYTSPVSIGPTNLQWQLKRALSAIQPVYLEATAFMRAQKRQAVADLRFQAIYWKSADMMRPQAFLADFTPAGPIVSTFKPIPPLKHLVADPRRPQWYGNNAALLKVDLAANRSAKFDVKGDLPELSHPCGLAWDSRRNRLVVTSFGGVGYMYAYQPDTNVWSLITDMKNADLCSIAYSADEDCFYGLVGLYRGRDLFIRQYAANGAAGRDIDFNRPIGQTDTMVMHTAPPQIVALGKHLIVLFPPSGPRDAATGPMSCIIIDSKTRDTIYVGELHPRAEAKRDLTAAQFQRLWDLLPDDATATEAAKNLAAGGDSTVKLLRAKLLPRTTIAPEIEARAIHTLALIGTPAAADLLRDLARGPADAARVAIAKAALRSF